MKLSRVLLLGGGLLAAQGALADTVVMNFEGATSFASVAQFYNGGTDSSGATGPYLSAVYGDDLLAFSENFSYSNGGSELGSVVMAPVSGTAAVLDSTVDFTDFVSFLYSSTDATTVTVWSDPGATGTLLATLNLAANAQQNGCIDSAFCFWSQASTSFSGTARSIQFGNAAGVAGFDNVSYNAPAVPLPAAGWLLLSALGGLGTVARRRRAV